MIPGLLFDPPRWLLELGLGLVALLLVTLAVLGAYHSGVRQGEITGQVAALQAHADEQHAAEVRAARAVDSLRRLRQELDRVRATRARAAVQAVAAARRTTGRATLSPVTLSQVTRDLDSAAVTIATDSGAVTYALPRPVADQWALERRADSAAFAALDQQHAADAAALAVADARDRARDSVDVALRAQLADTRAALRLLQRTHAPRFGFLPGTALGALGTLLLVVLLH